MPDSFSSEIGDVHERPGDRPSFTNEFEGASDSLIERDRPPRAFDIGRRGRRLALALILSVGALVGGGWAVWYWAEPIGEWIAGLGREESIAEVEPKPAPVEPAPAPVEPPPETTELAPPVVTPPPVGPIPGELPVESLDTPVPASAPASVEVATTSVRGRISSASVGSKLAAVDEALASCWTAAAAKPETKRPATLTLSFTIKWNGRRNASSIAGDAPKAVERCVSEALPSGGWPQPRDGGEGQVSRTWTLK